MPVAPDQPERLRGMLEPPGNQLIVSARPEMVIFANLFVGRKKLSSEYQIYACGNFFHPPRS
jgi:hypothetical protein